MDTVSTMGSGTLGRELDLEALVTGIENVVGQSVDANHTSGGIVTLRLKDGGPAYTIYRTGTFQIRGPTSLEGLEDAEAAFLDVLEKIDVEVPEYEFAHVTSVFMEDLGQEVNLSALTIALGLDTTEYEPEQFPGVVYRPDESEFVLLIFASGKVILTGGRSKVDAERTFSLLRERLDDLSTQ